MNYAALSDKEEEIGCVGGGLGFLINFNVPVIRDGINRLIL